MAAGTSASVLPHGGLQTRSHSNDWQSSGPEHGSPSSSNGWPSSMDAIAVQAVAKAMTSGSRLPFAIVTTSPER